MAKNVSLRVFVEAQKIEQPFAETRSGCKLPSTALLKGKVNATKPHDNAKRFMGPVKNERFGE